MTSRWILDKKILPTSSVLEVASIVAELHYWTNFNKILYFNLMDLKGVFNKLETSKIYI